MNKDNIIYKIIEHIVKRLYILVRWSVVAVFMAVITGIIGGLFYFLLACSKTFFNSHWYAVLFLPCAGIFIAFIYKKFDKAGKQNTNLVIASIHSDKNVPIKMMPLIFFSTILTHLFGGSAGREGAALQIGGSIGNFFGNIFKFDDKDKHVLIMCGMSGAFAALFKTPMAAAVFSMEVISVGVMYYSALVPCVIAALVSVSIASVFSSHVENFNIAFIPEFNLINGTKIFIISILCAAVSVLFCIILHKCEHIFKIYIRNVYLRIIIGGVIIVILTFLIGTNDYNGAGMEIIEKAVEGNVVWYAFIMKIVFTAITLGTGYKGGEIVPALFVGASFGCLAGTIAGLSPSLCAAVGMISVFCGVTNCPISSLLLGFELFGMEASKYFILAIAVSYMVSGYYGLYRSQKIIYSKYKSEYVNVNVRD